MKKIKYFIFALFLISQLFFNICFSSSDIKEDFKDLSRFAGFLKETAAVNSEKVDRDLVYGAIRGMAWTLDKHTYFFTPPEIKAYDEKMKGKYGGLGARVQIYSDILTIIHPFKNGPADKAGLKANDKIIKINGESTKGMKMNDCVERMRGKEKTDVLLTVLREEPEEKTFEVSVMREQVEVDSIYPYVFDNVGYILMTQFGNYTGEEIQKALEQFQKEDIKGVILDLRNNGGGRLDSAVKVVSSFVRSSEVVVSTEGRNANNNAVYRTNTFPLKIICDLPLVVLVNERSASASELTSGALQDYGRAIIFGTTTYGKGSVQNNWPLGYVGYAKEAGYYSAFKITGAHYFTPKHRLIHDIGVVPDIEEKAKPASLFINELASKGCFFKYAKAYMKKFPLIKEDELKISAAMLGEFAGLATESGVLVTESDIKREENSLKKYIKIEIARIAFGYDVSQKVTAQEDEQVKHAVELIKAMIVLKSFSDIPVSSPQK